MGRAQKLGNANANLRLVSTGLDPILAEHAEEIRKLHKRALADIIEIGRRLDACREHLEHGQWYAWLRREFGGWSRHTADNYIRVFEASKTPNFSDLRLPVSALYLLVAPSTPEETRTEIVERAKAGKPMSLGEVERAIADAKRRNDEASIEAGDDVEVSADNILNPVMYKGTVPYKHTFAHAAFKNRSETALAAINDAIKKTNQCLDLKTPIVDETVFVTVNKLTDAWTELRDKIHAALSRPRKRLAS